MRQIKRIGRAVHVVVYFIQNDAGDGGGVNGIDVGYRNVRSVGCDDHINIGCRDGILQPILEADADVNGGEDSHDVTSA